jgi:CheY-like chemotaxis protein
VNAQKKTETVRRLSILVADDEPDTVATLAALLTDEGHTVHSVYRGDHVPEAVRRFKPDVCILDIVMPGKTGYDLAHELSQLGPQRPVLIAMSGVYVRDSEQFLAQAVGFDRSFVKPTDPGKLLALIEQIAASDKQI